MLVITSKTKTKKQTTTKVNSSNIRVHARARRWAAPLQESFYIDTNKTRVPRECEMNSGAAMGKLCVR